MRRKSLSGAACPIARTLDVIGDWWSLLIVRDCLKGMRRFGELQKNLDVSKNILTRRLRALVAQDILTLQPAADGSAYQEYALTDKGRSLFPVLVALSQWGRENLAGVDPNPMTLVDREYRQPVRPIEIRAHDGRVLGPGETVMTRLG
jgi:DNA-binding HxlR family transcriptional regulator